MSVLTVHWSHEEKYHNQAGDGGSTASSSDIRRQGDGANGVDNQQEVGFEDGRERRCDKSTNGEGDECIGQHAGCSWLGKCRILGDVEEKERRYGHLQGHGLAFPNIPIRSTD